MATEYAKVTEGGNGLQITTTGLSTVLPGEYDLDIYEGQTWTLKLTWFQPQTQEVDVSSGYTAMFQARQDRDSTTKLINLTESSGITLSASEPSITITLTGTQTAALSFTRAVYDLVVTKTSGTVVTPLLTGAITLHQRVSA